MKLTGQCLCGELQYEISKEPVLAFLCHCKDCQRSGGSFFHAGLTVQKDGFEITSGDPVIYQSQSDSGNRIYRRFCGKCGSGICNDIPDFAPDFVVIKVGTLDDTSQVQPAREVWVQSKSPCIDTVGETEVFKTQPAVGRS